MNASQDPMESDLPVKLSQPALRALHGAGFWQLEQVAAHSENEIKRLHGIGPNAIDQLRRAFAEKGLSFAGSQPAAAASSAAGSQRLRFHAVLQLEGKTATGIQVPPEIVAALGTTKRPPVLVTIGKHTYRSTVAAYGEVFMLPVSAENREKAGISAGDELLVEIELDTQPRQVDVPPDFAEALKRDADARCFFEGLSYSSQRRFVLQIEDAKTSETRQRRILKIIGQLHAGKL